MPIPTELETWLADLAKEGELTPETVATLRSTFESAPKAAEYAKGSVLRQADYSKHIAEAKRRQTELDAEKQRLDTLLADTSNRSAAEEAKYQAQIKAAVARAETYERKFLAAQQKLRSEYNVGDETLKDLGLDEVVAPPVTATPPAADDRYVSRDTFGEFEKAARTIYPQIPAMINDLNAEHVELYGKPMRGAVDLVNEAIKTGRPMADLADERFGFSKRREELATAARKQEIADAVKAARVEWESQQAMTQRPGAVTGAQGTRLERAGVINSDTAAPVNGDAAKAQARLNAVLASRAQRQAQQSG